MGPDAVLALIRASTDPEAAVRAAAFELLSTRAEHEATRWLIDRLAIDADRSRVLTALAHPGDGRIDGILVALERADAATSEWLVEALLRMQVPQGSAAAQAVLEFDNVHARRAAAAALVRVKTAAAREAVLRAASLDPDPEVRQICAAAV